MTYSSQYRTHTHIVN